MENKPIFESEPSQKSSESSSGETVLKIEEINSRLNGGNGLVTLKEIIAFLKQGRIVEAKALATFDSDKLAGKSEDMRAVRELIKSELFRGDPDHPWSLVE